MAKVQAVTSIPRSPDEDRNRRMVQYAVGWLIRLGCLIACVFVRELWLIIPLAIVAIGAPMVLVVLANAVGSSRRTVERPGAIVRVPDSHR
jgi:hypothetical protein